MTDPNYLADRNPFSLARPPSWWLRGLYAFDPALVLLPARHKPLFLLARRRTLSRGISTVLDRKLRIDDPGNVTPARTCDAYGLVLVTTIICLGGAWTSASLQVCCDELRRRDTWTHGEGPLDEAAQRKALFEGGSALAKQIDAQDDAARARLNRQEHEANWHATGDAWRSRQARVGSRVLNAGRPSQLQPRGLIATPKPLMPNRGRLIGV
jgi:hypothetical protein